MAANSTTATKPLLPLKTTLKLAVSSFAFDSCRSKYTVKRRLFNFLDPKVPAPSTTLINGVSVTSSDVSVDPSRHLSFRLFVPATTDSPQKLPLIVFIHGGGFAFFTASTKPYDNLGRRIAGALPAIVVSVNYRLAPEHRFPSQYDDVFDQLKFIDSQNHSVLPSNADLSRCFITGDSAGGNIAHHVLLRASRNREDLKALKIVGMVMIQPFFGGEERTESELRLTRVPYLNLERTDWAWRAFLPEGSNRDHEAVNVFGGSWESESEWEDTWPATIVLVGGFDPLQDWQRRYYEGLKKRCGEGVVELIEYPNAIHAFYGFPELPEFGFFIRDMTNFVHKHSSSKSPN